MLSLRLRAPTALVIVLFLLSSLVGCSLGIRTALATPEPPVVEPTATATPAPPTATATATVPPTPTSTPTPELLLIGLDTSVPPSYDATLAGLLADVSLAVEGRSQVLSLTRNAAAAHLALAPLAEIPAEERLAQRYYAVVVPFASLQDDVPLAEVQARWNGSGAGASLATEDAVSDLAPVLGAFQGEMLHDWDLLARLQADPQALGVLPFDRLDPTYKVLTLDGVNVLSNHLADGQYPLAVGLHLLGSVPAPLGETLRARLAPLTNRDPERLTSLIMTGVTAMCRLTADRMETYGVLYPALAISDTLRAADITHVSNEVPFILGCEVDRRADNLTFCSDYDYWEALEVIGTDIVGLSGNHVNDFGYAGARESIAFYRDRGIPIYGSGLNLDEACAPIFVDDHGNRIAFLATLAWNPQSAWATDELPGTCYFYDHKERILQSIRDLRQQADIVAVELQYLETYNPFPTDQQVAEFRELRDAGATIVTGVQSHVPQSWEPYGQVDPHGPGIIVYGLGNLFFDQMWSWETRTELVARHTLYDGRLISSEILTAVLEDYAQPRWATPEERAEILNRIHGAAPER